MSRGDHHERLRRNAESKDHAKRDRQPWEHDEHELLMSWDGSEDELWELAALLERTIEACRERFYKTRRGKVSWYTKTVTTTTTEYRGWTEDMGDGC